MPRRFVIALTCLFVAVPTVGAQQPDTTRAAPHPPLFTARDAGYAGALALGTAALFPLDQRIAEHAVHSSLVHDRFARHVATDFRLLGDPGVLVIGAALYGTGRLAHWPRVADVGLHSTEAIVAAVATTFLIKSVVGRARPYVVADTAPFDFELGRGLTGGNDYSSLPSGHTAAGFAFAAAVTAETSRWWPHSTWYIGPVMYGSATLIGLSRVFNNDHWASDVFLAAGIGTFSGLKVVRYQHLSRPGNRLDRWLLSASIVPAPHGGVALRWSIVPDLAPVGGRGASPANEK